MKVINSYTESVMEDLRFEEFTFKDMPELQSWFAQPNAENKFINDYADVETWLELIESSDKRFGYMIYQDLQPIAFLDLELYDDHSASIAFGVKPELRGKGLGKKIIQEVMNLPSLKTITQIHAGVEPDNIASQKVLLSNGFRKTTEEGIIEFEKEIN